MISRRKARIKALQALYMDQVYDQNYLSEDPQKLKDFYKKSLAQTVDQVYTVLWFMKRVNEYAAVDYDQQLNRLAEGKTADDKILKLTKLKFVEKCNSEEVFRKKVEKLHLQDEVEVALIRSLYKIYIESQLTQDFLSETKEAPTERELLSFLLTDILLSSEAFQDFMEEKYNLWYDDETEVANIILRMLEDGFEDVDLSLSVNSNIYDLGLTIIDAVLSKKGYFDELIQPKLKNWDPKRIAPLSIIALYMGIAEFLYQPTIPTVVTINEYIDITKQYGADSNKQFVNALLDKVKKQLSEEKLIVKD